MKGDFFVLEALRVPWKGCRRGGLWEAGGCWKMGGCNMSVTVRSAYIQPASDILRVRAS